MFTEIIFVIIASLALMAIIASAIRRVDEQLFLRKILGMQSGLTIMGFVRENKAFVVVSTLIIFSIISGFHLVHSDDTAPAGPERRCK